MKSLRWKSLSAALALGVAYFVAGSGTAEAVVAQSSGSAHGRLTVVAITGAVSGPIDPAPADLGLFTDIALCDDPIDCINGVDAAKDGFGSNTVALKAIEHGIVKAGPGLFQAFSPGDGIDNASSATAGVTTSASGSRSIAGTTTDGILQIVNVLSEAVTVDFLLEWDYVVSSFSLSPLAEAFTDAFVIIELDGDPIAGVDAVHPFSDSRLGGGTFSDSGSFRFSVTADPGQIRNMFMIVDVISEARSVPEPSTLLLLGVGFIGTAWVMRRRRTAA